MKKDIEWLKREIHKELEAWIDVEGGINVFGINDIMILIDQLDEPDKRVQLETAYKDILSRREFLFGDKKYVVVEKSTAEEEQIMEWLDNNDFYDHRTAETVLANAVDKGELGYYGTKYSVVKKEPETVADVVTTFWKSYERLKEVMSMEVEELEENDND